MSHSGAGVHAKESSFSANTLREGPARRRKVTTQFLVTKRGRVSGAAADLPVEALFLVVGPALRPEPVGEPGERENVRSGRGECSNAGTYDGGPFSRGFGRSDGTAGVIWRLRATRRATWSAALLAVWVLLGVVGFSLRRGFRVGGHRFVYGLRDDLVGLLERLAELHLGRV